MPKYYLWMKQIGYGCDYTIGCGEVFVPLEGDLDNLDALTKEVLEQIDYHGEELQDAKVVSSVFDAMPLYRKQEAKYREAQELVDREAKLAELERLKKELGVE